MWIKKEEYNHLLSLQQDFEILKSLVNRVTMDGMFFAEGLVIMSDDVWSDFNTKWKADKDAVMRLVAERDWYKQKYAEFAMASEMKG